MGFDNRTDIELVLENIVYSDLRSRGYDVHVGCRGNKEVDFVAVNGSSRLYIQVSYLIAPEQTRDREFGALEAIADNYPKLVLSMDPMTQSRNGIEHLNIVDFLLDEGAA